ncbi:MAG: hypothetical protein NTW52_03285 [Planctomycetota bacterium]|nr:hypothetical protein [Planctomycetota bacterium]
MSRSTLTSPLMVATRIDKLTWRVGGWLLLDVEVSFECDKVVLNDKHGRKE